MLASYRDKNYFVESFAHFLTREILLKWKLMDLSQFFEVRGKDFMQIVIGGEIFLRNFVVVVRNIKWHPSRHSTTQKFSQVPVPRKLCAM